MRRAIAAGVGGAGGWRALTWAAAEAERTADRLVMLHVCVPGSPLERGGGEPTPGELEVLDPALGRAFANARTRLGRRHTDLRIRGGDPAARLVEASAGAGVLVIGAGEGGNTVRRVLRHAHCPVVVVRPGRSAREAPFAGHVVVGVDGSSASRGALEFAAPYAVDHALPLTAVNVARGGGDRVFDEPHAPGGPPELALLAEEVSPWALKYPEMVVRYAVLGSGGVADRLLRAGAGARLLVVGDKRRGVIGRARTGDVPLTVASEAPCPVAVVPMDQHEEEPL